MLPSLHLLATESKRSRRKYDREDGEDDELVVRLEALVPSSMWLYSLQVEDGVYVFIGEDHYVGIDKQTLASSIRSLAERSKIELYVEDVSGSLQEEEDRLAELSGVTAYRTEDRLEDPIIVQLSGIQNATYFSSRPEYLQSGIMVDPGFLVDLMSLARQCIDIRDIRSGRAIELFTRCGNIAENILASSLLLAKQMVTDGSIDDRLISIITDYLKELLVDMRNELTKQVSWPIFQYLRAAINLPHSTFISVLERCVFAPHIVSDAVLATTLKKTGFRGRHVVIVSGRAHSLALKRMLDHLYG